MLKLQIPKNRINYLIKQVQTHFDTTQLEQGWEYFHKGRVSGVELDRTTVEALVKGRKPYEVAIHLEEFSQSECSCSYEGCCKHMAATFFSLYSPYGRPELLLQQLKQVIRTRKKPSKLAAATPERKSAASALPTREMMPQEWHRFFEGKFHGFSVSHQNSIEAFFDTALETLPAFAADWETTWMQLYELHIVLFMMRRIEQFYQETKSSYLSYYHENGCKVTAAKCEKKLQSILKKINLETSIQAASKHWQATLTMLGELSLNGKESPIQWLFVYRTIWWSMKPKQDWLQREMKRLEQLLEKKDLNSRKKDLLTIARAHFDVILDNLEEAFKRLNGVDSLRAEDFFLYIHTSYKLGQWEKVLIWLRWLLPVIHKADHDDFRTFCQYWMDTSKHLDSDAEWVGVMESLLPRSYYYYTSYLLQSGRYKQWIDLQLANRISPLNLYALELKTMEEHDPGLLLPLYHQAVERAVLEKNRAAYKTAARLLKKLRDYYKELGQESRWEIYINRLAHKFSRLRAFQEELKKGKWIR